MSLQESSTAPPVITVAGACVCGHDLLDHGLLTLTTRCDHDGCDCRSFRYANIYDPEEHQ